MNRRTLLAAIGTASVGIAGCTGNRDDGRSPAENDSGLNNSRTEDDGLTYEWRHDIPGRSLTVAQGTVIGEEIFKSLDDPEVDGGIFALDSETGDHLWTHGSSDPVYSGYSAPVVEDAIYAVKGDDTGSHGTTALNFDGQSLWSVSGELAAIADGVAYLRTPHLHAVDTTDGTTVWQTDFPAGMEEIVLDESRSERHDTVYVTRAGYGRVNEDGERSEFATELFALSRDDGSTQWRYGNGTDREIGELTFVSDEVAYLIGGDEHSVVAVSEGEILWSANSFPEQHSSFTAPQVVGATTDCVFIKDQSLIRALDIATGEERWTHETRDQQLYESRLYVADHDQLIALNAAEGTQLWSREIGGVIQAIDIVSEGGEDGDHSIFLTSGTELYRVTPEGDVTWRWDGEQSIEEVAVGQSVVVATEDHIYGIDPQ